MVIFMRIRANSYYDLDTMKRDPATPENITDLLKVDAMEKLYTLPTRHGCTLYARNGAQEAGEELNIAAQRMTGKDVYGDVLLCGVPAKKEKNKTNSGEDYHYDNG